MKSKKSFIERFKRNKKKIKKTQIRSNARIFINDEKDGILVCDAKDLSSVTHLSGCGTWTNEDFNQLKQILKTGLSKMSANVSLHEINLSEVVLSKESPEISFKELFSYCVNLTKVTLPDATDYKRSINFHATFKGCSKLKTLLNMETYKQISDIRSTFYYCNLLSEIKISATPLPKGDEDTFLKVSHDIQVLIPQGAIIPSVWSQIKTENVVFSPLL